MEKVRDIFVFCCYTGLAYADVEKLTPNDISTGIDGEKWIIIHRQKTDSRSPIPILPKAMEIIEKYKNNPENISKGELLPMVLPLKTFVCLISTIKLYLFGTFSEKIDFQVVYKRAGKKFRKFHFHLEISKISIHLLNKL